MNQNELRAKMPLIGQFIDSLCDVFGRESIHGQIRRGLQGEPVFYATENGYEVGTRLEHGEDVTWHPVTGCAIAVKRKIIE